MLAGRWTCRSYRNDPALVDGVPAAALGLILMEAVLDLEEGGGGGTVRGGFGMADGRAMAVAGRVLGGGGDPDWGLTASGLPGTGTDGWLYEFRCRLAHRWPEAAHQAEALVGTVIRMAVPGSAELAAEAASFVAVRQDPVEAARGRPPRRNVLTAGI